MSVFAGVFSRRGEPIPESLRKTLRNAVSRNPHDHRTVYEHPLAFIVKVDFGAFGASGYRRDPRTGSVAMLAGEPLLANGHGTSNSRLCDLQAIQADLDAGHSGELSRATGVFAFAHFQPASGRLTLTTDKLGIRPLYFWKGEDFVVFSTALRVLEQIPQVPRTPDLTGITELISVHLYAVGDRTAYADVKRICAAEKISFKAETVESSRYWDWRKAVQPEKITPEDAASRTYKLFIEAVARRWRGDSPVPSCLSGGLDSRCVVAALRHLGAEVCAFNYYAVYKSQEQVFAAQFAKAIGADYTTMELPIWQSGASFEGNIFKAWREELERHGRGQEVLSALWTGDGGSVALGHLMATPEIVSHLRAGNYEEAFALHRYRKPPALFKPEVWRELNDAMLTDFRREIEWAGCDDPARAFHLLLMLHQQRYGSLAQHFENIDAHRLEYHTPFFDSDLLGSVLSLPLDWCLRHRFYYKILTLFPKPVSTVPWQAYPGHEPCPLPIASDLSTQWGDQQLNFKADLMRRELVDEARKILQSPDFPSTVMRRHHLRLALWLHATGLRNCNFPLNMLSKFYRHWKKSAGASSPVHATGANASTAVAAVAAILTTVNLTDFADLLAAFC